MANNEHFLFYFLFFLPFSSLLFLWMLLLLSATVDILDGFATSLTPRKRTKHEKVATGDRMEAGVALPHPWEAPPPASVPLPVPLNFYHHCLRPPIHRKKRKFINWIEKCGTFIFILEIHFVITIIWPRLIAVWSSEEPIEDNVSADSGVSLTPSTNETQSQSEPTSEQPPPPQQQQQSQPTNLEAAQAEASKKPGIILD